MFEDFEYKVNGHYRLNSKIEPHGAFYLKEIFAEQDFNKRFSHGFENNWVVM